ncbi:glycine cleavage system protein H [Anaeromyxobacter oryzisoli]|uniref:glycine cleavage system protein H n=1 Tax=Anaeromyxobacter oryzisoli TaxID=2925408 RepID=UPI001F5A4220|nr:glycine cleavage system protein H [Anaeromyxobacter sp. SG63]
MTYDLLSVYPAKLLEYTLAIGYLLLFIPFWRYVQGGKRVAAEVPVRAPARIPARPAYAGWFQVPAGVHLHPGHTWARLEPDGLVAVGADDFAHRLVGPARVELPRLGDKVAQGEPALALVQADRRVPMLAPVDGTVVAVNAAAGERAEGTEDPYGAGWLFKVKPPRLAANLRQLLSGAPAHRLLDEASERLALRMSPELGRVLQDGGTPVHGIAQELSGDDWDGFARTFFLT